MRTRITNLVLARFAKKLFLRYYAFLVLNASNIFFCRPGISERCLVSLPYRVVATRLSVRRPVAGVLQKFDGRVVR